MLSYQHIYHAGNKADVHKHLWLITVLDYLRRKDKPLTWIDTHAGRGLYDLQAPEPQKLQEYQDGVLKLPPQLPPLAAGDSSPLQIYRQIIRFCNSSDTIRYYPGSARIAAHMLRPADHLYAYDQHPQESAGLQAALGSFANATAQKENGLERLLALIPPKTRRGGALIDPSYGIKKDYETIGGTLSAAIKKWPQGVYMIWYPILAAGLHERLKNHCASLAPAPLIDEWIWADLCSKGMSGSGMIIFNAPHTTADTMARVKNDVLPALSWG